MNAIETHALKKSYGAVRALDGLDLSVKEGEFLALLGVNGAGKTTAIKLLTGIAGPDGGEAYIMGHDLKKEADTVRSLVGVSPQETAVAGNLTVWENLFFMAGLSISDRAERTAAAEEMMSALSLEEVRRRRAKTLSGGWQRRLSIAMALVGKPRVLFLDEPTLGLDVIARRELWQVLLSLKGRLTVVLTTHYLEEACALADRIAILSRGQLRCVGTEQDIITLSGKDNFEDAFVKLAAGEVEP